MARTGMNHGFDYTNLLTEEKLTEVMLGTSHVLSSTGVTVKDKQMQKTLTDYGCTVDSAMDRVYFNDTVISKALNQSPSSFVCTARDKNNNIELNSGKTTYFINACGMKTVDLDTGDIREPSRKEFYDHLRVIDALPNVDIQNCFPYFGFAKVPECMKLLESVAAKYRVSTKVQIEGTVFDNYLFSTEMAKAMGIDLLQIVNSAAPLTYFAETSDQIRNYAEAGLPFHFAAGPTRGMTCPMSAVGAVISNNAEALAGIVMAQAFSPGSRVWVNSMILTPNMSDASPAFGDIGNSLTDGVFNQVWRKYGIPSWSNAASWTSSKAIDYQAASEMTMALMVQAMTGASAISFQGGMYAELAAHPVKAIIDDDIAGMVRRMMQGVDTSPEAMAIDLIEQTGPIPGSFFESDLTLETWRDECYIPTVSSREPHESWMKTGKKNILDIARQKLEVILENHKIVLLEPSKEQALEDILKEARTYYRKKGLISDAEWHLYQEDLNSPNYPFA